jgi:hypothetical protein
MKAKAMSIFLILVVCSFGCATAYAGPPKNRHNDKTSKQTPEIEQLLVFVHRGEKGVDFDMGYGHQKKSDANFTLAELKLQHGSRCQLIILIDESLDLGVISQVGQMAINAGFTDIRPFVYWSSTEKIAEIQFGPLIKFAPNAEMIDARLDQAKEMVEKAEKKRLEKERKKDSSK